MISVSLHNVKHVRLDNTEAENQFPKYSCVELRDISNSRVDIFFKDSDDLESAKKMRSALNEVIEFMENDNVHI